MADSRERDLLNMFYNTYGRPRGYLDPVIPVGKQSSEVSYKDMIGKALMSLQGIGVKGPMPAGIPPNLTTRELQQPLPGKINTLGGNQIPMNMLDQYISGGHAPVANENMTAAEAAHVQEIVEALKKTRNEIKDSIGGHFQPTGQEGHIIAPTSKYYKDFIPSVRSWGDIANRKPLPSEHDLAVKDMQRIPIGNYFEGPAGRFTDYPKGPGNVGLEHLELLPAEANQNPGPLDAAGGPGKNVGSPMRGPNVPDDLKYNIASQIERIKAKGYSDELARSLTAQQRTLILKPDLLDNEFGIEVPPPDKK